MRGVFERRKEATPADAEAVIARALESGGEDFANGWSDAGEGGQRFLRVLAKGQPLPDLPDARKWLRGHDGLDDEGRFPVPMMERWVRVNG